jgi:hypothetical protein
MNKSTSVRPGFYPNAWLWLLIPFFVTITGFMPSYFLRLAETGPFHHFHGITATLWMILLVTQPLLYRFGRIRIHRICGRATLLLVPMIVIGGLIMVSYMLNDPRYSGTLAYRLSFLDFMILAQFTLFYTLAAGYVRNTPLHARFMICTVFGPVVPALTRLLFVIPWVDSFHKSLHISFAAVEVTLLILVLDDKRKGGIRLPYLIAMVFAVSAHLLMGVVAEWSAWQILMDRYAELGLGR